MFRDFERQGLKYQEDLKHMKQKIKKLEEKLKKDSSKIDDLTKECDSSKDLIPKLEEKILELQRLLQDEEKFLEDIKENSEVEAERYCTELAKVWSELEPWEKDLIEHKGKHEEVDAEFKLQDMKKLYKELEMKKKGYKKRLDDLEIALTKHLELIQKDLVDPEKLQVTLSGETLTEPCQLKRALEMVALLEAQLKEINPNLDSISEYRRKVSLYNE